MNFSSKEYGEENQGDPRDFEHQTTMTVIPTYITILAEAMERGEPIRLCGPVSRVAASEARRIAAAKSVGPPLPAATSYIYIEEAIKVDAEVWAAISSRRCSAAGDRSTDKTQQ